MNKRNLATVLWFAMGWTVGSIIAIAVGLPSIVGVFMGIPFAAFVRRGPVRRVWAPDELAARHDRRARSGAPVPTD